MVLFLSANIHQGDDLFSINSRGKQCAFMSLSAVLTAQNIPLSTWSKMTIDNVLLQADQMYLNALSSGFIVLDPCVDFLSVDDLPKVVNVSFDRNMFSYQICQTVQGNKAATITRNSDNLPLVIEGIVSQNTSDVTDLPVVVAQNASDLPVVVAQRTSDVPVVAQRTSDVPVLVPENASNLSVVVAQHNDKVPIDISVQPNQDQNKNQIWAIHYGKELQGLVIADQEIESHYYDIHTALFNTFLNDNHAILILEGYMVAIIKQTDFFYLFDSHARDMSGMPDHNGTAVMMRFTNILELEQCLSSELHTNSYEIVPIQVNKFISAFDIQKKNRLQKASESKKRKRSEETESERQIRLQKDRLSKKQKRLDETDIERQVRPEKKKLNKKQKQSNESDSARQIRLQRDRLYKKQKRSEQAKKQSTPKISQQEYLNTFDITQNGGIEEQSWAKANINKFHKSVQYTVSQCTVCKEAWPLKSKPRVPYVCSRCVRDNKSPRKFSYENSMIPSSVPTELQDLTQIEEMLIARALPIMRIYIKPGGQ